MRLVDVVGIDIGKFDEQGDPIRIVHRIARRSDRDTDRKPRDTRYRGEQGPAVFRRHPCRRALGRPEVDGVMKMRVVRHSDLLDYRVENLSMVVCR